MGKRELLIIVAFVAIGVAAYQLTAPPPKPGQRRFSFTEIFSGMRRQISANAASASITKAGTLGVRAGIRELRVTTARSVPLTIIGEAREDIAYEMPVESTGPDEATAREWAGKTQLRQDDLGPAMSLATAFPNEGTQSATLTLRVPARLAVRVENSGRIQVSKVAAVELRNITGEVTLTAVAGDVTGSHRSGDLTVNGAGTLDLSLSSSRATIRDVARGVTVTARSGECSIADSPGPVTASLTNAEIVINAQKGPVKVTGEGGDLKVLDAHDLSVDARRMLVDVDAAPAPGDQITIITTDERLRVSLRGAPAVTVDAATTNGGRILASDFGLEPTTTDETTRLAAAIGAGGANLVLRNSRGEIVIGRRK